MVDENQIPESKPSKATATLIQKATARRNVLGRLNTVQSVQFARLAQEYKSRLCESSDSPEAKAAIREILDLPEWVQAIEHLEALELAVYRLRTTAELKAELEPLAERLRHVSPELAETKLVCSDTAEREEILSLITVTIRRIYRAIAKVLVQERKRSDLLQLSALSTAITAFAFFLMIGVWVTGQAKMYMPPLFFVMFAGVLGGLVGTFAPISKIGVRHDAVLADEEIRTAQTTLYVAPISGMFFSIVLFLLIAAGFLKGELFPDIQSATDKEVASYVFKTPVTSDADLKKNYETSSGKMRLLVGRMFPTTGQDFAKLLVWCFIAGYVSGFVPNTLSRLVTSHEKKPA